ncbi:MAG: hypothetical protein NUV74_02210 [Candidatus Brocadiaceae bacterium]|nr:hypothetical protein [Candidatus Brocadiaceae bacterium]
MNVPHKCFFFGLTFLVVSLSGCAVKHSKDTSTSNTSKLDIAPQKDVRYVQITSIYGHREKVYLDELSGNSKETVIEKLGYPEGAKAYYNFSCMCYRAEDPKWYDKKRWVYKMASEHKNSPSYLYIFFDEQGRVAMVLDF